VGNAVFLSQLDELYVLDPPFRVVVVVEEHHRRLLVDGTIQVFPRLDLHEPHTAVADGMVVAEAMGFLNDDLALHRGEVGKLDDLLPIRTGEHGCCSQVQGRGRPGCDHCGFTMKQRRNSLSDFVVEVIEHHVMFGGVVDRLHHLRRHQRRRHGGVGSGGVDERTHAELAEVVAAARAARGSRIGRHRSGSDDASHDRQSRDDFKKTSSAPHCDLHG